MTTVNKHKMKLYLLNQKQHRLKSNQSKCAQVCYNQIPHEELNEDKTNFCLHNQKCDAALICFHVVVDGVESATQQCFQS